ncbi:MAG: hypothetical protein ACK5V3_16140, partial [Bdellovibrionales bacterium]
MKTYLILLSSTLSLVLVSSFASAASVLKSTSQLQSFNCALSSAAGYTQLKFDSEKNKNAVSGSRNSFVPVSYQLSTAGQYGNLQKSHITLSGGSLGRGQYLSLLFNTQLPTGKVRASGT